MSLMEILKKVQRDYLVASCPAISQNIYMYPRVGEVIETVGQLGSCPQKVLANDASFVCRRFEVRVFLVSSIQSNIFVLLLHQTLHHERQRMLYQIIFDIILPTLAIYILRGYHCLGLRKSWLIFA